MLKIKHFDNQKLAIHEKNFTINIVTQFIEIIRFVYENRKNNVMSKTKF